MRASSPRVDERAGPVSGGFVAVALETAGPDPMRLEVVEAALVAVSGDGGRERLETLIRPSHDISPEWLDAAGLERSDFALAPDWAEFAPRFRRLIAGRPLVAMSAATLRAALDAAGMYLPNPVYDAGDLATFLLHDQPSYRLEAIAAALGIDPPRGRGAIATAETTAAVFSELLRRVDRFDGTMLEQLAFLTRFGGLPEAEVFAAAAKTAPSGPLFAAGIGEERIGAPELAFLNHRERPEPLRETGSRGKIDPAAVSSALATGGPLSRTVRDYERRPQQEAMALNVAKAFSSDQHLLVEAGTGTGKSLAYLLPAALHARETGENVVISTNTLALQDQLFRKDLPDLEAALGLDANDGLKATVLKGRQNYLCLRSWFSWQRSAPADPAEARLRARIMTWLPDTETGDRAELRLSAEEEAGWRNVAEDEDACVASRCPFFQRNQCFLYRARKKAEASHLVIVNHALLLSDAVSPSRILPEYERLIVDEAHHLEDQATTQFGHSISERDLADLADAVARRDGGMAGGCIAVAAAFLQTVAADEKSRLAGAEAGNRVLAAIGHADALRSGAARFFAAAHGLAVARGGGMDRSLRLVDAVRADPGWESVETLLLPLDGALRALDDELRWSAQALARCDLPAGDEELLLQRDSLQLDIEMAERDLRELAARLRAAVTEPDPGMVYWIERWTIGDRCSLHAAPIEVGAVLRERLFGNLRTAVLTSATLTTDGAFDYIGDRLGMEHAETFAVSSPFDYERSTLLFLADDMPEPSSPAYPAALQRLLIETCAATGGRALVLFTSYASLQATARAIRDPLARQGITVLAQRQDGAPRQLIEHLRESPATVLLGTATFWEGVDIVGPALSLLVIAKLPFSVPSDPVFAARSERFDDPFGQYAIPQAVLRFKQGFGRLIRSSRDRGVCAVLDRRVLTKRYGTSFISSLPPCSVRVGSGYDLPDAAASWIVEAGKGSKP